MQTVRLISNQHFAGARVSVQGVKSLGGHFARLCQGVEFYEVKKNCYYLKTKIGNTFILLSFL